MTSFKLGLSVDGATFRRAVPRYVTLREFNYYFASMFASPSPPSRATDFNLKAALWFRIRLRKTFRERSRRGLHKQLLKKITDEWHTLAEFPERSFVKETPTLFGANIRERWATSKATQIIGSSCAKAARCDRWRLRDYVGAAHKRNHEGEISQLQTAGVVCVYL